MQRILFGVLICFFAAFTQTRAWGVSNSQINQTIGELQKCLGRNSGEQKFFYSALCIAANENGNFPKILDLESQWRNIKGGPGRDQEHASKFASTVAYKALENAAIAAIKIMSRSHEAVSSLDVAHSVSLVCKDNPMCTPAVTSVLSHDLSTNVGAEAEKLDTCEELITADTDLQLMNHELTKLQYTSDGFSGELSQQDAEKWRAEFQQTLLESPLADLYQTPTFQKKFKSIQISPLSSWQGKTVSCPSKSGKCFLPTKSPLDLGLTPTDIEQARKEELDMIHHHALDVGNSLTNIFKSPTGALDRHAQLSLMTLAPTETAETLDAYPNYDDVVCRNLIQKRYDSQDRNIMIAMGVIVGATAGTLTAGTAGGALALGDEALSQFGNFSFAAALVTNLANYQASKARSEKYTNAAVSHLVDWQTFYSYKSQAENAVSERIPGNLAKIIAINFGLNAIAGMINGGIFANVAQNIFGGKIAALTGLKILNVNTGRQYAQAAAAQLTKSLDHGGRTSSNILLIANGNKESSFVLSLNKGSRIADAKVASVTQPNSFVFQSPSCKPKNPDFMNDLFGPAKN